ncbi:hypothetical protein FB45DRAFT_829782 [Roridomyces roridus]|uniref:BTB domain-containing protein n=1 Tax=Roridomyces roridus TaxID=1738132 RepID=A0AAD7FNQ4_9AGAR|nr:hypothetical protein FB45DRAFT_829782 [Roridomyces roridus]
MDTLPATAKRKRAEESDPETTTPTRSHSIWKPFGDIVLQVESAQFRVSRDNLATQSSVFADMFAVPQPPGEPTVEGCPVVILSGDKARDWELLLQVLYDPFGDQEALSFEVIAAMLRLGRKYGFATAEANAIRRIHFEYPNNLDIWDRSSNAFTKIEEYEGLVADILNLAHEFGINSSVPVIAYSCLYMHSLDEIFIGIQRPDSSRVVLHPDIQTMLAIGVARITSFQFTSFSWLDNNDVVPSISCTNRTGCDRGLNDLRRSCVANSRFDAPSFFILKTREGDWWSDHFCHYCAAVAQDAFNANRVQAWDALPSFFGLPEWDELKDLQ